MNTGVYRDVRMKALQFFTIKPEGIKISLEFECLGLDFLNDWTVHL